MAIAMIHDVLGVTPTEVTEPVARLLQRVHLEAVPVFVAVVPDATAEPDECFLNCDRAARTRGGEVVFGWAIWLSPVIARAQFHAVLRNAAGELVDVTPKTNGCDRVLFADDSRTKYEGRQINDVLIPVYPTDALAAAFIRASEREFAILNRGSRAFEYGHVAISDGEKKTIEEKHNLEHKLAMRPIGPQYPCVCGRGGKKMKNCCGKRQ